MTPSSPHWSNWFSLFKYLFSFPLPQSHHRGHQLISVATLSVSLSCLALLSCLYLLKTFDIVFHVNGDPWPRNTRALNHSPLGWAPPNTDVIHSCLPFLNDPLWTRWVLFNLSPEESDGGWRVRRGTAWRSQPLRKKCFFNLKLYFILDFKYCIIIYSCFNIAVIFPNFNWIPQEDVACLSYSLEYPWPISYWEARTNKIKCKILSPAHQPYRTYWAYSLRSSSETTHHPNSLSKLQWFRNPCLPPTNFLPAQSSHQTPTQLMTLSLSDTPLRNPP